MAKETAIDFYIQKEILFFFYKGFVLVLVILNLSNHLLEQFWVFFGNQNKLPPPIASVIVYVRLRKFLFPF